MKNPLSNIWFLLVLRLTIGGVFLYAGFTKLIHPQAFADSIETFKLLPTQYINLLAIALPPLEMIVGCLLIIGVKQKLASFTAFLLPVIFGFALIQGIARGLMLDCGCFGSGAPSMTKTWTSVVRDILLLTTAFILFIQATKADFQGEKNAT